MEMTKKELNFEKTCRTCLNQDKPMKSVFETINGDTSSVIEMLYNLVNIHVNCDDKLPKQLCITCIDCINHLETFKRKCFESEKVLNNYLNTKGTDNEFIKQESNFTVISEPETVVTTETQVKLKLYECLPCFTSFVKISEYKNHMLLAHNIKNVEEDTTCHSNEENNDIKDEIDDDYLNNFDDGLETDFKEENVNKTFPCICGAIFENSNLYSKHMNLKNCWNQTTVDTKTKLHLCRLCNVYFESIKEARAHRRLHKNKEIETNKHECPHCKRKLINKHSYLKHMKLHKERAESKHTCDICKRDFKHRAHLENHISSLHLKNKGFNCEICKKPFSNKDDLEKHMESHKDQRYHCETCSKRFTMLSTLKDHYRIHTGEKPYLCSTCGKGFSQKTNLAQHLKRHLGVKPFKCDRCEKSFVSKGELESHVRKHTGAHPFVCDDCGVGFTTASSLGKHRRIHTGERPYACDLCTMKFAALGTLKNHRRTHTGEKPYQCSHCHKAFVQRNDLVSHIRCHTGERPYVCTTCGQSFRKTSTLKAHVKMHFKESEPL